MKALSFRKALPLFLLLGFTVAAMPARADDDPDEVALAKACDEGRLDDVKKLIFQGVSLDSNTGSYGETPLGNAADSDHLEVLQFLLDKGARPDFADNEGSTPLLHACNTDSTDCALALIKAGANVNQGSNWHRTPLMYAAQKGNDTIVAALLAAKADIDANCSDGPAVYWAVANNKPSTVKLLADAGANLALMPVGYDTRMYVYTLMATAVMKADGQMVDYLVSKGVSVESPDMDGRTALMAASFWSKADSVRELLAMGAKINAKDNKGRTALMETAFVGDTKMIELLLVKGADIDATDNQGETALTLAGDRGEVGVVDLLTQKGAQRTDTHIIATDPSPEPLTTAQAWALGVVALYAQKNGQNPYILGLNPHLLGFNAINDQAPLLKDGSGITSHDSLLKVLDDLRDHGYHTEYQNQGIALSRLSDTDLQNLIEQHIDKAVQIKATRDSYNKWQARTGLAWDICRSAYLVNMGYGAHYLTEQEAWDRLMEIARQAQGNFSSWQELSDNYLDGREIWSNKRDPDWDACAKLLLNPKEPNSPWNQLPWKTDLSSLSAN